MKRENDLSLCLVTDSRLAGERGLEAIVAAAVEGGCTMVQLREKEADTRTFLRRAEAVKRVLVGTGVPLLINDRVDIALAVDADGVHLGQSDMPVAMARQLLGEKKIIGLSVENTAQALAANDEPIDYIGISPVFGTPTKPDIAPPLGAEGTRAVVALCRYPAIGIGGINRQTVTEAMSYGLTGIAVVSDIMTDAHPKEAARALRAAVEASLKQQKR